MKLAVLCAALGATACVRENKTPTDTLVIGIEAEVRNLDLRSATDANSVHVARLMCQGLVRIGPDLMLDSDLAQSFQSQDGRIFRFTLPADARFHDGHPLTSADLRYSLAQASGPGSRMRSLFADLESFEAPDPRNFVIRLKAPRPAFLSSDLPSLRIFPAHLGQTPEFARQPVCSGPYRFIKRRDRDLIFERFPDYRAFSQGNAVPLPTFAKLIVRTVSDPTTRFLSLVGGDLDIVFNALSPRRVQEIERLPYLKVHRAPGTSYQYLGLNLQSPKLRDVRVRRALSLAINRDDIIRHKLRGLARPASSVLTPENPFHHSALAPTPYDPGLARRLLKQAGAENLELELKTSTDRDTVSVLQVITRQWQEVGVRARLNSRDFATFFADVQEGRFEVFSLRWTAIADLDLLNKIFHSKERPPGRNRVGYSNAEVDRLLDTATRSARLEQRMKAYKRVQELIEQDVPYVSLWYPENVAVATARLREYQPHPLGSWTNALWARKETRP